ncbi:MAG: PEGA domain-containing protein [Candidatus Kentron sp. G]|nr:MAG: PEGA domain-containing protein [Candidatus Kentron sp. G]VFM95673.1 MAG: PEGA domain-containing protein [Candidatus Kentron sp. G]VFN03324.1 MAG: PEGA domain-containing protein [Candidatus Kentron sp. G]
MRGARIILIFLTLTLFAPGGLGASGRVALVIGNSDYGELRDLRNPRGDAEAVAGRLSKLGFSLVDARGRPGGRPVYDLSQEAFFDVIDRFARQARGKEIALVYYAGHGMQIGGQSYLLPVDTPKKRLKMIERRAISLERDVLEPLDNRAELTVAIFDACREIPDVEKATRASGLGASATRGLARVRGKSRTQRIIAYSAAAGELAADGRGRHSPYTALLLEQLDKDPHRTVETLVAQVAHDFSKRHGGQQPEFLNQGVEPNRYYLKKPVSVIPGPGRADRPTEEDLPGESGEGGFWSNLFGLGSADNTDVEITFWNTVKQSEDPELYRAYLKDYPNGRFARLARIMVRKLARPAVIMGQLVVGSNVSGDTVYIDGKAVGPTDPGAHELAPGEYTIRVEKEGFEPFETKVTLVAGEEETVRARLAASTPTPGQTFRDRLDDGSSGPEMVSIPGGCFQMGSPTSEKKRDGDERQHRVCVEGFALGKYEVTFAEYDRFARATGRNLPSDSGWGRGRRPVIRVSWHDATAYAEWLSRETGKQYRLPTEAEWEYAARAGTTTAFSTGRCIHTNQANYNGNVDYAGCGAKTGVDRGKTVPVGSLPANPWGAA